MPDFKWIGSGVSEPQVAENDHPPLTWHIALTTVYALTCYTVMARPWVIKRWCCLTSDVCLFVCLISVAYIRSAGSVCGWPAAWRVLADRARLGRPVLVCLLLQKQISTKLHLYRVYIGKKSSLKVNFWSSVEDDHKRGRQKVTSK